jgi:hypothetical protein
MKRLEVKNLYTIEELKREIRETKDGRYSLRLRCVLLRKEGKSTKEIQDSLLVIPIRKIELTNGTDIAYDSYVGIKRA